MEKGARRKRLTQIINTPLRRHSLLHTPKHVHLIFVSEHTPNNVREIRDDDSRVEVTIEQRLTGIFEPRLRKTLDADELVHIAHFVFLFLRWMVVNIYSDNNKAPLNVERKRTNVILVNDQVPLQPPLPLISESERVFELVRVN